MTTATLTAAPTIREATEADVSRLVEMGQRFRNETVYQSRVPENTDQMEALTRQLIASDAGLLLVADREGALVGMLGALLFPHHISGRLTGGELFFWVEPEHRGHGVRLVKQAERWARARGAVAMQLIAPTADVEVLYQRLGYTRLEVAYEKSFTKESSCL